ncbi:hypothetical protein [Rhodovibrio salinarum]|nr:hypothetical protein [Rhodovibrio salinarum]
MSESVTETREARQEERSAAVQEKTAWETPEMEDVSEQVMAQPYIRFT